MPRDFRIRVLEWALRMESAAKDVAPQSLLTATKLGEAEKRLAGQPERPASVSPRTVIGAMAAGMAHERP